MPLWRWINYLLGILTCPRGRWAMFESCRRACSRFDNRVTTRLERDDVLGLQFICVQMSRICRNFCAVARFREGCSVREIAVISISGMRQGSKSIPRDFSIQRIRHPEQALGHRVRAMDMWERQRFRVSIVIPIARSHGNLSMVAPLRRTVYYRALLQTTFRLYTQSHSARNYHRSRSSQSVHTVQAKYTGMPAFRNDYLVCDLKSSWKHLPF